MISMPCHGGSELLVGTETHLPLAPLNLSQCPCPPILASALLVHISPVFDWNRAPIHHQVSRVVPFSEEGADIRREAHSWGSHNGGFVEHKFIIAQLDNRKVSRRDGVCRHSRSCIVAVAEADRVGSFWHGQRCRPF